MKNKIASFEWDVTSIDTKTHIKQGFIVDKPYDRLIFEVSYSPKFEEDRDRCFLLMKEAIEKYGHSKEIYTDEVLEKYIPLANHIAWTIDSPKGCVGTKHKHDEKQTFIVSKEKSSDGFFPCEIVEGEWQLTTSLNAILTEKVHIVVEIYGDIKDEMA